MPNDDILTMKELAAYLKIAEKTAYKYALEGKVPGFKVGGIGDLGRVRLSVGFKPSKKW